MPSPNFNGFSVRTITAGVVLESTDNLNPIEEAAQFLESAQRSFEDAGAVVQSTRIATQSQAALYRSQGPDKALRALQKLDRYVTDRGLLISVGALIDSDHNDPDFPSFAAELASTTQETYFSVAVADDDSKVYHQSVLTAARAILAIARVGGNGEANFRFGAAARIPASTPFFPVAHHCGPPAFSIALESAGLVREAFQGTVRMDTATAALRSTLETRLTPIQSLAQTVSERTSRRYAGIDLSPAPSLDASIAGPIESLTGQPLGAPTTLAACAAITQALKTADLVSCGYSGLMLPLLEDRVLAQRAIENRFGVQDLLLYSSVCGTGLDVIPLAGDCSEQELSGLILDMAVLACRLRKPLAARLLPIPGKRAGDAVDFANPHLTSSVALPAR